MGWMTVDRESTGPGVDPLFDLWCQMLSKLWGRNAFIEKLEVEAFPIVLVPPVSGG